MLDGCRRAVTAHGQFPAEDFIAIHRLILQASSEVHDVNITLKETLDAARRLRRRNLPPPPLIRGPDQGPTADQLPLISMPDQP